MLASDTNALPASFDSDSVPIIIDSGASVTLTHSMKDFISYKEYDIPRIVSGISSGLSLKGRGTIMWHVVNDHGQIVPITIRDVQYVPELPMRLLSPQQLLQQDEDPNRYFSLYPACAILRWDWNIIRVPYDSNSFLPIMHTAEGNRRYQAFMAQVPPEPHDEDGTSILRPQSLTLREKAYIRWHHRLGHPSEAVMHSLAKEKRIPHWLASVKAPMCRACQFGKQTKRPRGDLGDLRAGFPDIPGGCVSIDQFVSHTPGRVLTFSGKPTTKTHSCVTIFVDHATDKIYCYPQESTDARETIEGKQAFENQCMTHDVGIQHYHCDNGIFRSKAFVDECKSRGQSMTFCGVNAHHQNGIAERAIRTITVNARTMLLHATSMWPEVVKFDLWPFAVKMAVDLHNAIPTSRHPGITPDELFAGVQPVEHCRLNNFHVFGCPVFVLDESLQADNRIPRWDPRSRQGVFLGFSSHHANNVAYVLNIRTNEISPQYHLVFDDLFQTVNVQRTNILTQEIWDGLYAPHNIIHHELDLSADQPITMVPQPSENPIEVPHESHHYTISSQTREADRRDILPFIASPLRTDAPEHPSHASEHASPASAQNSPMAQPVSIADKTIPKELVMHINDAVCKLLDKEYPKLAKRKRMIAEREQKAQSGPQRRSTRARKVPFNLKDFDTQLPNGASLDEVLAKQAMALGNLPKREQTTAYKAVLTALKSLKGDDLNLVEAVAPTVSEQLSNIERFNDAHRSMQGYHPLCFQASQGNLGANSDSLTYGEMNRAPDKEHFEHEMLSEFQTMLSNKVFELTSRSSLPPGRKVVKAIWSFRRKRTPSGVVYRRRARLCAHGGQQQEGVDFFETYAPVVAWSTVRLVFVLAILKGLKSRQIDYVQAFPQAPLDDEVYMELPKGVMSENEGARDYILRLRKNLYGLRQAAMNWFEYLKAGLIKRGFRQSTIDPCLFTKDDTILLVYVDDTLIFAKDQKVIDQLIESLRSEFDLTDEGDNVKQFLGVQISHHKDGSVEMTQPHLTRQIIKQLGLDGECKMHDTPADVRGFDESTDSPTDGDKAREDSKWNYRSIIGQLLYLANNTRPDIAYAVHHCARASQDPKASHRIAVKRIGRYLKRTADKGIIYKIDKSKTTLDCYADADFAGLWGKSNPDDPVSVTSRTGYVIRHFGCPILWHSKLQTEIALSTTEAEYISLSSAMRDLIPMRIILSEIGKVLDISDQEIVCHSKVFEDNKGAEELANVPKMRPRTKHIAVKYHHFRSHVANGTIKVLRIGTKEQIADIFTKALPRETFLILRKQLLGW